MSLYNPRASGLGNSAAYQVAGKPYVTGSIIQFEPSVSAAISKEYKVTFPSVTRSITIKNNCSGSNLAVYFSPKASSPSIMSGSQYLVVPCTAQMKDAGESTGSFTMNIKCKEIYISPMPQGRNDAIFSGQVGGVPAQGHFESFAVFAELTGVPSSEMYELTGSGINASTFGDGHN